MERVVNMCDEHALCVECVWQEYMVCGVYV